jgi:Mrp family chromosome partitioning ATPase
MPVTHSVGRVLTLDGCWTAHGMEYRRVRTIAVMNEKGGSGKTTTTISLAAVLAERGYRILVVDLDPQASASLWLGRGREPGLYRAIADKRNLEPFSALGRVFGVGWGRPHSFRRVSGLQR